MECDRQSLVSLIGRCPHGEQPSECPLAAVRHLGARQQLAWLRGLNDQQIAELCFQHSICPCNRDTRGSGVFDQL